MIDFDKVILSNEECEYLINLATNTDMQLATVTTGELHYRTSHLSVFGKGSDPIIDKVYANIVAITEFPIGNIENIQINRYLPGEYFKPHYDFLPQELIEHSGGQRLQTFLLYLNTPLAGGETYFQHTLEKITPKPGRAIVWSNCVKGTNELDQNSLHESMPVLEGEKWMLVTWIRESEHIPRVSS